MDHTWWQPWLPPGFVGSRKVTGSLGGTQCSDQHHAGCMPASCPDTSGQDNCNVCWAFGDVCADFSSHAVQSPTISMVLGAMLPLLRDQRAAVLRQPKYNYANSSQPVLKTP